MVARSIAYCWVIALFPTYRDAPGLAAQLEVASTSLKKTLCTRGAPGSKSLADVNLGSLIASATGGVAGVGRRPGRACPPVSNQSVFWLILVKLHLECTRSFRLMNAHRPIGESEAWCGWLLEARRAPAPHA